MLAETRAVLGSIDLLSLTSRLQPTSSRNGPSTWLRCNFASRGIEWNHVLARHPSTLLVFCEQYADHGTNTCLVNICARCFTFATSFAPAFTQPVLQRDTIYDIEFQPVPRIRSHLLHTPYLSPWFDELSPGSHSYLGPLSPFHGVGFQISCNMTTDLWHLFIRRVISLFKHFALRRKSTRCEWRQGQTGRSSKVTRGNR